MSSKTIKQATVSKKKSVHIEEEYDGFAVYVGDKRYRFDQEDSIADLVDVFKDLGIDATYEEVY